MHNIPYIKRTHDKSSYNEKKITLSLFLIWDTQNSSHEKKEQKLHGISESEQYIKIHKRVSKHCQ